MTLPRHSDDFEEAVAVEMAEGDIPESVSRGRLYAAIRATRREVRETKLEVVKVKEQLWGNGNPTSSFNARVLSLEAHATVVRWTLTVAAGAGIIWVVTQLLELT